MASQRAVACVAIAVGLRRPNSLVWCRQPETAEALNDLLRFDPLAAKVSAPLPPLSLKYTKADQSRGQCPQGRAGSESRRRRLLGQPAWLPSVRARPPCALSMLSG